MGYDTNIIYGTTKLNYNSFSLNKFYYYKTKTGISKKHKNNEKPSKITNEEYDNAWSNLQDLFE